MLSPKDYQAARISGDPRFDGLFFVLVKSTMIFCRNTCKVKSPLEKNVEYATSAQQALTMGYRPCLRCRPDSAPNSPAWQGVNATVNRAVSLLSTRLDTSIESISDALGITPRYLHKLFAEHLQISPKRFRIYQQVLLAKRLLQQTALPVEAVAEAVGFPSARQLQEHVKTYLRLTPSQLRKVSLTRTSEQPDGQDALNQDVSILLSYRPPYNWPQVRDFYDKRQIDTNEKVETHGFEKVLNLESKDVVVNIEHEPTKHGFRIRFNAQHSSHTLDIINIVRRMLDLDASPSIIENAIASATLPAASIVSGLRIPGVASEFEAGCRAILGQQVSVAAAVNKLNAFYAFFASEYTQRRFPSPEQVAEHDLMFLKIPAKRRQTLIDLAKHYVKRDIQNNKLRNSDPRCTDALLEIKGIGPWTVNYIRMRALGDCDIWLDTDLVIKQQFNKLSEQNINLMADKAAPFRSYLTLNLWSISG